MINILDRLNDSRWLRDQQEKLGLTNKELAEELCCDISHIGHMRSGRRGVSPITKKVIGILLKEKGLDNK